MTTIGRLYLTLPLYTALARTERGLDFAREVFAAAVAGYHPLTRRAVERRLARATTGTPTDA